MKAAFMRLDGSPGTMDYEAIVPQPMQHVDGFTLLGFHSWEDVADEKIASAVTNVREFHLDKKTRKVGFGEDKD